MFFEILQNIFIEIRFLKANHIFLGARIPRHWIILVLLQIVLVNNFKAHEYVF